MEYFILLGVATLLIAALAAALYRQRGDLGVVVGIAALYYWSLYGAWSIVIDKTGGFSGQHYQYLEHKMFPINLDGRYLLTLVLYALFIILVELTLLAALSRRRARPIPRLVLRHDAILLAGLVAGIASYLVIRDKLSMAAAIHTSAYWYTRSQSDQWFTLHQVLNRVALIPPAIGIATLAAGKRSRYFLNVDRRYTWPAYLLLAAGMSAFTFVLGNKNEVLTALLAGCANLRRLARAAAVVEDRTSVSGGCMVFGGGGFLSRYADFGDRHSRIRAGPGLGGCQPFCGHQ